MKPIDFSRLPIINCPLCGSKEFEMVAKRKDGGKIVRCLNCQHNYLNPTLPKSILDEFYHDAYFGEVPLDERDSAYVLTMDSYFYNPNGPYLVAFNWILQHGGFEGKKILDIGCGTARFLSECVKKGAAVTGIDASCKAAEVAKKYYGLDIVCGFLEDIKKRGLLEFKSYDMAFSFEAIEHVEKPVEFIKTISEFIKEGGYLVLSTPNFTLFKLEGPGYSGISYFPEHIHFFFPKGLAKLLNDCGFEVLLITTLNKIEYGDRIKFRAANLSLIRSVWDRIKSVRLIYYLKDCLLSALNSIKEKEDKLNLSGSDILCIARKR